MEDRIAPLKIDVSECCVNQNVSEGCMDACSFDQLDFHKVINRGECVPDFSKLMKCAAGKQNSLVLTFKIVIYSCKKIGT